MRVYYTAMRRIATGWMYVGIGAVILSSALILLWFGVSAAYAAFVDLDTSAPSWLVPLWPFGSLALMCFGMLFGFGGYSIRKILDHFNERQ